MWPKKLLLETGEESHDRRDPGCDRSEEVQEGGSEDWRNVLNAICGTLACPAEPPEVHCAMARDAHTALGRKENCVHLEKME